VVWGDSSHADVEKFAREANQLSPIFSPLRDATADLRPGRDNRIVDLIAALRRQVMLIGSKIEQAAVAANAALFQVGFP